MKLLYVSSGHPLLEADDCLTWEKLGIEWYSTGFYNQTDTPGDLPYIHMKSRETYKEEFDEQKQSHNEVQLNINKNTQWTNMMPNNLFHFSKSFLDRFDCVFFSHFACNVLYNAGFLVDKPTILRTYGMHCPSDEKNIRAMKQTLPKFKIIRTAATDVTRVPNKRDYGGCDQVIRQSVVKDEHEISGWTGDIPRVCTFTSYLFDTEHAIHVARCHNYKAIARRTRACDFFGINNNFIAHKAKVKILRDYRVNLVTGTPCAANTYSFIEAWIMGQPIVCFGRNMWAGTAYEIDTLMTHGVDGFIGNTKQECVNYCKQLLNDHSLAQQISKNARAKALTYFSRDVISQQWKELYDSCM